MEIRPIFSALLRSKTGAVLIALQVALTLAILSNASYVVQDRLAVAARPTGTDEENVFFTRWYAFREGVDIPAMLDRDLALIRAIPGVRSVATANMAPLTQSGWNLSVSRHQDAEREETFNTAFYFTSESLIDALGLELVQGRDFRPDEVQIVEPSIANIEPKSAILTRALAEQLFPDESEYVGKTAFLGDSQFEVVGIVERLQSPWAQLERRGEVSMIVPMRQLVASAAFMVRSEPGQQARAKRCGSRTGQGHGRTSSPWDDHADGSAGQSLPHPSRHGLAAVVGHGLAAARHCIGDCRHGVAMGESAAQADWNSSRHWSATE